MAQKKLLAILKHPSLLKVEKSRLDHLYGIPRRPKSLNIV
jgi:hypothetical protein